MTSHSETADKSKTRTYKKYLSQNTPTHPHHPSCKKYVGLSLTSWISLQKSKWSTYRSAKPTKSKRTGNWCETLVADSNCPTKDTRPAGKNECIFVPKEERPRHKRFGNFALRKKTTKCVWPFFLNPLSKADCKTAPNAQLTESAAWILNQSSSP